MEDNISIPLTNPRKRKREDEVSSLLTSRRALTEFHDKCLNFVRERNSTYLSPDEVGELLGIEEKLPKNFVRDVINVMLQNNMMEYNELSGKPLCRPLVINKGVDLATLSREEHIIYNQIQAAGNSGIWTKTLGTRLNISNNVLTKCYKSLETRKIIKRVKSVKNPYRVILMLYSLEPGDDLTGGPWYSEDKGLDEGFVESLLQVALHFVNKKSYPPPTKINHPDGAVEEVDRYYVPGYRGYATAEDVFEYIMKSNVIADEVRETFGVSHVHKLLEVLCYKNQIQKRTDGTTYRTVRDDDDVVSTEEKDKYYDDEMVNVEELDIVLGHKGYTEAPCGKCPVFKICGNPGEDISAANCVYWDEWTRRITEVEYF